MKQLSVAVLLAFSGSQLGFDEQPSIQTELTTSYESASEVPNDIKKALRKHAEILILFKLHYMEEIDAVEFTEKLYKGGIAAASDPNSRYLNKKEVKHQESALEGNFAGIGIRLEFKKDAKTGSYKILVAAVFPDTPAKKAGLEPGDVLVAVSSTGSKENRISVNDLPIADITDLVRGKIGTKVTVWVLKNGQVEEFTMQRARIEIPSVSFRKLSPKIGYLQLSDFSQTTEDDFTVAVDSLVASNMKTLIIDVRNNPGGLLNIVILITDHFKPAPNLPTVYLKSREGDFEPPLVKKLLPSLLPSFSGGRYQDLKVVILINEWSASASEILAGWFKEEFGAPVIGEKSFGKGSVQGCFNLLSEQETMLCLTTHHYFIGRNKVPVHHLGIEPTVKVKNPVPKKGQKPADLQLQKAIEEAKKLLKDEY